MKKIILVLLVFMLIFSLSACLKKKEGEHNSSDGIDYQRYYKEYFFENEEMFTEIVETLENYNDTFDIIINDEDFKVNSYTDNEEVERTIKENHRLEELFLVLKSEIEGINRANVAEKVLDNSCIFYIHQSSGGFSRGFVYDYTKSGEYMNYIEISENWYYFSNPHI